MFIPLTLILKGIRKFFDHNCCPHSYCQYQYYFYEIIIIILMIVIIVIMRFFYLSIDLTSPSLFLQLLHLVLLWLPSSLTNMHMIKTQEEDGEQVCYHVRLLMRTFMHMYMYRYYAHTRGVPFYSYKHIHPHIQS